MGKKNLDSHFSENRAALSVMIFFVFFCGEDKQAFLRQNRTSLVQRVRSVEAVLDDMLRFGALSGEAASGVRAERTAPARVRRLLDHVTSRAAAALLFNALLEHQRDVMLELLGARQEQPHSDFTTPGKKKKLTEWLILLAIFVRKHLHQSKARRWPGRREEEKTTVAVNRPTAYICFTFGAVRFSITLVFFKCCLKSSKRIRKSAIAKKKVLLPGNTTWKQLLL